jgi:uncharacterized protein with HEPN domain
VTDPPSKVRDAAEGTVALCDVLAELTQMDVEAFVTDIRSQWAVEMGLIRIGEAVNRIPEDVLTQFPHQPWRQIVAMRKLAAHQYDDLDPHRVWRTVTGDVPALRVYLAAILLPEIQAGATLTRLEAPD